MDIQSLVREAITNYFEDAINDWIESEVSCKITDLEACDIRQALDNCPRVNEMIEESVNDTLEDALIDYVDDVLN